MLFRSARPTVAIVSYLDLDLRDIAKEVVEDQSAIAKYGVITTELSAFACTSRGQARRAGEWLLYSEWNEGEVVSFSTSVDSGVVVRPGMIISIADPVKAGARRGGRIAAATTTTVTADDITGISIGASPALSVILPDGTVETRTVASIASNVFTVSAAFSTAPNVNSVWLYETSDIEASTWRVLSITEEDGISYSISAIAHNAGKYDYIERDVPLQPRDITNLNVIPEAPTNLNAQELIYEDRGMAKVKLLVSWSPVVGVSQYRARWRYTDSNWTTLTVDAPDFEILDVIPGTYEVQVFSLSAGLLPSTAAALLTKQTFGKTALPATVAGLSLIPIDEASAVLSWTRSTELDVLLGGKVIIRHSVDSVTATWEESNDIVSAAAGSQTQKQVPLLEGTYLVKFEDDGGRRSLNAATVVVDLPTPQPRYLLQTYAEETETPPFNGNYTNMFYVSNLAEANNASGIVLASGTSIDSMATDNNWDGLPSIDSVGGVLSEGEYEFGSTYSLPGVFDVNLRRRLVTTPYIPGDFWDDHTADIDTWDFIEDRKSTRLNSSHVSESRMPSSA